MLVVSENLTFHQLIFSLDPEERKKYEDMNYAAAKGLPMNELAEWYILQSNELIKANSKI